jgi:hypothetical protein
MQTRNWGLPVIMTVAAAGGGSHLVIRHGLVKDVQCEVAQTPIPEQSDPEEADRGLNRRKLESIGSTRDLQPLPIPQGATR